MSAKRKRTKAESGSIKINFDFNTFRESIDDKTNEPEWIFPADACRWNWNCKFLFMKDGTMKQSLIVDADGPVIGTWELV